MGKIIVKNIKGMGWKARIGLISVFTLAFSVLIYQGWNQLRNADAAIGMSAWTTLYNNATTYPNATSVSYTPLAATSNKNRLLVVTVSTARTTVGSQTATITFGGQALTLANGNMTLTSVRQHSAIYYLREAGIATALGAGTAANFALTVGSGTSSGTILYATTLSNVDQNAPISFSQIMTSTTTATSAPTFAAALSTNANDKSIAIVNSFRTASGTARTLTTVGTNWVQPTAGAAGNVTNVNGTTNVMRAIAMDKAIPTAANSSTTPATTMSGTSLMAMTGISVKAATTALGNGTDITSANVAPAAANQKLDGFSFVTSSAGTTDSVTGLTVTSTGSTAIASMSIWNEAGTTQYFTTVNNPAATQAFSGGTPIPVTSTSASYKIFVTYDPRATAPAGNTATTARVSAYTCTNIQTTGTDTAGTTLTLLNTHAASTWGTLTPGNNQIILNWTKGTPTQSVIIARYPANSDTTKPVDGTAYAVNATLGTGTVVYNGAALTYTNTGLTNGTTYYYKIFEFDALNYYYNATDVWTPALTPISPDTVAPTVDVGFAATTPVNTLAVPISGYSATDNIGGSGVSGYLITTSSAQPAAGDAGWVGVPPTSYTVGAAGSYTLYPWAKDAGNNVSPLYGSPVPVVVDMTAPTVATFTVTTPSISRNIPLTAFTGSEATTGIAGYLVTTSATVPAVDNPGWLASAPTIFPVGSDGTVTLYPWVKDGAGNVSAVFGTPRTVVVDATAPTGLSMTFPADEATAVAEILTLTWSSATDANGPVTYQFQISSDSGYMQNSGWISSTSFSPIDGTDPDTPTVGLTQGERYTWNVKAKDSLGNETAWLTSRSFTVTAPCVRNDTIVTLLSPAGGIAKTISTDSGTTAYNVRLINNDTGNCGSTTFNLSIVDTDTLFAFDDSVFDNAATGATTKAITLQPSTEATAVLWVRATPTHDSGVQRTIVNVAADAFHTATVTGFVQTTLNVTTCSPRTPLLIVGPSSGYLNKSGSMVYTITVKNTDTGSACTPVVFNLSKTSESNSTDFNASQFSTSSLTLNSGELGSATLTVSAKSTAALNAINNTVIHLQASDFPTHPAPADVTVVSTVNNPMLHNSDNTASTKWAVSGGWGTPNGRYGEIDCNTCHVGGGGDTANIKRVNEQVFTPYTGAHNHFPGEGKPIAYRRYVGDSASKPVLGWDAGATPRLSPTATKICEACHTYDATKVNGVNAHPFSTSATLGNHFNTDGTDCTRCHKHNKGFGAANMSCNSCHGDPNAASITPANRYVVAPPTAASGVSGTISGTGQVSNNPMAGAHQTHLQYFNGFSNYSTVDYRCQSCHGALPTDFTHASDNSLPAFQGMATRGGKTPTFSTATLTCSNTYCHNPVGVTIGAANTGSAIFPSWTSSSYITDGTKKTANNCNSCHKSPNGTSFVAPNYDHGNMPLADDCVGCHGHDGDTQGEIGKRHIDGYMFGAGKCNQCHGYESASWATAPAIHAEGNGAHVKHINYLVSRFSVTLNPDVDKFGVDTALSNGSWTKVCQVCHSGSVHMGGTNRTVSFNSIVIQHGPSARIYDGTPGTSSATVPKTCSNIACHYLKTPIWSTY